MLIATIDTGTTNSRVRIWSDGKLLARGNASVGVRDTAISGNNDSLKRGVKQAIQDAAMSCGVQVGELDLILASGMITSNLGFVEVPHVNSPAGLDELASAMVSANVPEVAAQPIWFIPGVKNKTPEDLVANFDQIDFMRGEEVEALALVEKLSLPSGALLVLPGSHNKLVEVSPQRKILSCTTTLSGEMLAALTGHTILAGSLCGQQVQELDIDWLERGAEVSFREGLTRSAFAVRIITLKLNGSAQQAANYLLGAVLAEDLKALRAMTLRVPSAEVVIAGTSVLAKALEHLIRKDPLWADRVQLVKPELSSELAGQGVLHVAIRQGLIPSSFFSTQETL